MKNQYTKNQGSFEFNDLIDDAVQNAIARRYQALNPEDSLLDLSDKEMKDVLGGISSFPFRVPTIGLIYQNPPLF